MDDPTPGLRTGVLAGDADAFGEVFDLCARSVYNHAFRLTGDWLAAEDVMAMTFMEAWRGRARLVPDGGSLRPWLLGIATNLARSARARLAKLTEKEVHKNSRELPTTHGQLMVGHALACLSDVAEASGVTGKEAGR